jgi:hypothetical protein
MNILQIRIEVFDNPKTASVIEQITKTFQGVRSDVSVTLAASGHPANTYSQELSERPINFIAVLADDSIQVEVASTDSVYTHQGKFVVLEMGITGFTLTNTSANPIEAKIIYG